jgi:hypothetical protein
MTEALGAQGRALGDAVTPQVVGGDDPADGGRGAHDLVGHGALVEVVRALAPEGPQGLGEGGVAHRAARGDAGAPSALRKVRPSASRRRASTKRVEIAAMCALGV